MPSGAHGTGKGRGTTLSHHDHFRRTWRSGSGRFAAASLVATTVIAVGLASGGPSLASTPSQQAGSGHAPAPAYVSGQLLVRFASGTTPSAAAAVNATIGAHTVKSFSYLVPGLQLVQLPAGMSVSNAEVAYAQQAGVRYAQPNWVSQIDLASTPAAKGLAPTAAKKKEPNDPRYNEQWDWPKVDAPTAWGETTGSSKLVVMDIDTGMDYNHEDLAANAWENTKECKGQKGKDDDKNGYVDDCHGIDTINNDTDPIDDNGHGTHTGGTIGAVGDNKTGVTGFNWNVKVMPCKSHSEAGAGSVASIIECFQYAKMEKVKYGYDIVATNNSYGGCPEACDYDPATYDAIKALIKPGVIMAFAAGNASRDNDVRPNFPSNYDLPNIIAVAATDVNDGMAGFSQYGLRSVDVGAPGVNVLSTLPDDEYGSLSGTSMATPHVAGIVALLASWNPKLDWTEIRNLIIAGGDSIDSLKGKTVSGRRINAAGSMNCKGEKVFGMVSPVANTGSMKQSVEALNINCAKPAGDVKVTIKPGNDKLTLTDDGKGLDLVKGDGLYTADWTPKCGAGKFTFTFSNGKKYDVNVNACIKLDPDSGRAGSSTKVSGTGYTAAEIVDVFFDGKLVETVTADSKGKISAKVSIPKSAKKGGHLVTASGQTSGVASTAKFTVK
jgi:subtilisin family serine protease